MKWANVVGHAAGGGGARHTQIKLVDWEMAGWGDPALDVGSALGEALGVDQLRSESDRRAITALWQAYVRARRLDEVAANALLERATGFAGARLVQSAYEHTQVTAAPDGGRVARSLRRARRLLTAPREAAAELLGLAA